MTTTSRELETTLRKKRRILVVANGQSIHTARFVSLLSELGFDARIFQVEEGSFFEDQNLAGATIYVPYCPDFFSGRNRMWVSWPLSFEIKREGRFQATVQALAKWRNLKGDRFPDFVRVMKSFDPDLVISARMQSEGYFVAEAKRRMGDKFRAPWIHFLWGTDIEFFGKHEAYRKDHLPRIRQVLESCEYLFSDTQRDADQAPSFGFSGKHLGVFPAHGGFDLGWLSQMRNSVSSPRDTILIKGRQGSYVGHAINIVIALMRLSSHLRKYRIVVLLATPNLRDMLPDIGKAHSLSFEIADYVPYDDLMRLYGRSRLAISATTVDGMPSFLAEAMAMGALPVHSDMPSIREWADDGRNSLLFPVGDVGALEKAILRGLSDDTLFQEAAALNKSLVDRRLDRNAVGTAIGNALELVFETKTRSEVAR